MTIDYFLREIETRGSDYYAISMQLQQILKDGRDENSSEQWKEHCRGFYKRKIEQLKQHHADFNALWDAFFTQFEQKKD